MPALSGLGRIDKLVPSSYYDEYVSSVSDNPDSLARVVTLAGQRFVYLHDEEEVPVLCSLRVWPQKPTCLSRRSSPP